MLFNECEMVDYLNNILKKVNRLKTELSLKGVSLDDSGYKASCGQILYKVFESIDNPEKVKQLSDFLENHPSGLEGMNISFQTTKWLTNHDRK